MAPGNRPGSHKKVYGEGTGSVHTHGEGLGTGPVGAHDGYQGRSGNGGREGSGPVPVGSQGSSGGSFMKRNNGGGCLKYIIIAAVLLLGGGGGIFQAFNGGSTQSTQTSGGSYYEQYQEMLGGGSGSSSASQGQSQQASNPYSSFGDLFSSSWSGTGTGYGGQSASGTASSSVSNNTQSLDTSVAEGSRDKYTVLKGNGQDTATVMIYMCGADLESRSGMATSDLSEIAKADTSNVNIIVYTGGATKWNNNVISNQTNQVYQVTGGGLKKLVDNAGNGTMTDPATLSSFIQYCNKNFPADRNELIFWNHGGGSVSGYGYDEKNPRAGSMPLSGINKALSDGGVKFDFVGFDACLMATLENGLMLGKYADYLIASEETEPGYGWYYTNWVNALNQNTSIPTTELGKQICDDFVDVSARQAPGQKTTLSVVDLAELENVVPEAFKNFSNHTRELIKNKEYKQVSDARNSTREFAQTTKIDQIDLIDFAQNLGTEEGSKLAGALDGAIKYNRTSRNMTNAYGLSIYFPYQSVKNVDTAVKTYQLIGLDADYGKCIQEFANLEISGQVAAGGSASQIPSMFGDYTGTNYGGSSEMSQEIIGQLLGSFLSGGMGNMSDLYGAGDFFSGRDLSTQEVTDYIAENHFDAANLSWTEEGGQHLLKMSEDQWSLVHALDVNLFYDDGQGYVDLGTDNTFSFDDAGNLIGDTDGTWLSVNGEVVHYEHLDTMQDGEDLVITGRIPALLNENRVNLLVTFDSEHPAGYITGATTDYNNGETQTSAKNLTEIADGDTIQFITDRYDYNKNYEDTYLLGDAITVSGDLALAYIPVPGEYEVTYKIADIYNQIYWTPAIHEKH